MDQAVFLETVEHSRNVRSAGDETIGEDESIQRLGVPGPQYAKHVVLLRGKSVLGKEVVFDCAQAIVGPPKIQERLLVQGIESGLRVHKITASLEK